MSEGMVERVARAMAERQGWNWDKLIEDGEDRVEFFRDDARAAIAAMREPTEAMFDAGAESLYGHPRHKAEEWAKLDKYEGQGDNALTAYRAMIDAALKD